MQPSKKKRIADGSVDLKKGSSSMNEKQRNLMLDFLSQNPSMVLDRSVGGTSNKHSRDVLWEKLALILNNCGSAARKDGCGWRRSWQDLKRYESLKAKESMARLGKMNEPPLLILSPLQERIASLLNMSISDTALSEELNKSQDAKEKSSPSHDECLESTSEFLSKSKLDEERPQGDTPTETNMVQALQSIADALTERNAIEERKLRVFENLLTLYAAKNGISMTDVV